MATTRSGKRSTTGRKSTTKSRGSSGFRGRSASARSGAARGKTARRGTTRVSNTGHITTDHEEIRRWVEARGGSPACVLGTGGGGDEGVLRIDFPGYSGEGALQHIPWEEWFDKFDSANLALLYQEQTAGGQRSNFNKLVDRREMAGGGRGRGGSARSKSGSKSRGRHGRSS